MYFQKANTSNNHFIIAAPRSGTTWLSKMLNAHPQISCIERRLFGNYADFVLDVGQESPRLRVTLDKYVNSILLHHGMPENNKNSLMRSIIASLIKEEHRIFQKKIIVDKITPYLNSSQTVIEQITRFFPNAKIIYLVRDGRDVLTSGVFHWFNKQPANTTLSDFEIQRREAFRGNTITKPKRFFQDKEIQQWANEWQQPLLTIKGANQNHDVKIISYESMLQNPKSIMADCVTFLSIKSSNGLLETCVEAGSFKAMSKGRSRGELKADAHVRKGVSGDWNNYFTYEDAILFNGIAGDSLIDFGYEENNNWFERFR